MQPDNDTDVLSSGTSEPAVVGDLSRRGVGLLALGVPVSLLMDMADPQGPRSQEVFRTEGGSAAWL